MGRGHCGREDGGLRQGISLRRPGLPDSSPLGPGFRDYRLRVGGLVEKQAEFALSDLELLGKVEYVTMHHCIQGWTGIAKWSGIPMRAILEVVRPLPAARGAAAETLVRKAPDPGSEASRDADYGEVGDRGVKRHGVITVVVPVR